MNPRICTEINTFWHVAHTVSDLTALSSHTWGFGELKACLEGSKTPHTPAYFWFPLRHNPNKHRMNQKHGWIGPGTKLSDSMFIARTRWGLMEMIQKTTSRLIWNLDFLTSVCVTVQNRRWRMKTGFFKTSSRQVLMCYIHNPPRFICKSQIQVMISTWYKYILSFYHLMWRIRSTYSSTPTSTNKVSSSQVYFYIRMWIGRR